MRFADIYSQINKQVNDSDNWKNIDDYKKWIDEAENNMQAQIYKYNLIKTCSDLVIKKLKEYKKL